MDLIPLLRRLFDSNTSESSDSASNRLCDDVLINIPVRLPCKSATRFKLVCKRWYTLISSDCFIKLFTQFHHHYSDPLSYKLLFQFDHYKLVNKHTVLVPCASSTNPVVQSLDLSFLPCRPVGKIGVRASCADLILCSFKEDYFSSENDYYICNPRTKHWVAFPPISIPLHGYDAGLLCIPVPDNSRYKFAVMRVQPYYKDPSELQVQFFSSEDGQWRNHLVSSPQRLDINKRGNIVPYKGMLHWLNYPFVLVLDPFNAPRIISRVINIEPNIISANSHNIGVCCGRLRVSYSTIYHHYIWELEDYDMGKSSLVHKLKPIDYRSIYAYVDPDGNAVTKPSNNSSLWLCNLLTANEAIDLKYKSKDLYHYGINVHHIEDKCWPTPVPSLPLKRGADEN